ncbi:hypothetical protein [Pantoea sp. B65]|uniref:hypothetical protein n=1 Tax=Pantoea sp. B65 TaxID=2813359 RepID=UPI0039B5FFA2
MNTKLVGLALLFMTALTGASSAYACNLSWPNAGDFCHEHCKYNQSNISRFICELGSTPSQH